MPNKKEAEKKSKKTSKTATKKAVKKPISKATGSILGNRIIAVQSTKNEAQKFYHSRTLPNSTS